MSGIASELAGVRRAFAQPTLTLLHQRQAPVVITIFRAAFGRNNVPIPTARLHTQVEEHLAQARAAGETDLPAGSGREVCQRWMRGQWLVRSLDDDGREVYTLTSHAQQALELVKNLARDRATLSEHRIATILGTVRRFNAEANPDRSARVGILNAEIARLQAERDRLVDGGDLEGATEDYMLEGFTELLSLVSALPSDFARVEERFATIRGEILAAFRAEDRPAGQVIDDYLARADALMTATQEGRAFEGAFALLRDDGLVTQLREDLTALLEHPLSDGLVSDAERAELRGTVRLVRDGLDRVLVQRSRVTATLKDYIVSRDAARDRELEQVLRQVESELMTWMATTGPRATHGVPLLPARADVGHLRERFHDPADDVLPDRIEVADPDDAPPLSLSELVAQGGPRLVELRDRVDAALSSLLPPATLGELFDGLDADLRRPVEVFGLLHLAADRGWTGEDDVTEDFAAVRPDGSGRTFAVPRTPLPDPDRPTDASTDASTGSETRP
ncbi:DUF3375 domain-containing protein [Nocardioides deserti]|uniref:DUF3375 domain-containing protein n=1 Tax=Nocardioides deserti TaxID=1588644 RepID=A0ABR6U6R8_9ACTN|nr:DUF3375 domain-containing protein [Nocardioides deserti]MBC2960117.1 DUF3375 domain-containing protein [Nocardioides deserti]GGO74876.1 hypothetical protein GCM10012276_23870 [Nocardioides deserti]